MTHDPKEPVYQLLDSLAIKHGTDKSSKAHNYTRWYAEQLPHAPKLLVEFGIDRGFSLRMWKEYFRTTTIVGVDLNINQAIEGTFTFQGSCTSPSIMRDIITIDGNPDVIIDDASHKWQDQIDAFKLWWPKLEPGGVYVVEDVHTNYFMEFGQAGEQSFLDFMSKIYDNVNFYGAGGLGDIRNIIDYDKHKDDFGVYQKTVESITYYPSIIFIRKRKQCL